MAFKQWFIKIDNGLDRLCRSGAVTFFAAMILLVLFQIAARYLFRAVPTWTEEAARYCMIWGGLLGATAAFKSDKDPSVVNPPNLHSGFWGIAAFWLRALSVLIFLGPVVYFGRAFVIRTSHRATEAMGISYAVVTIAVPLAATIIIFHLIVKLIRGSFPNQP